jgi:nucleoside-diphosphate kinase
VFGAKMIRLSDEILREHYAHLTDLPFFPEIQGFMQSSPVVAIALRGDNAIARIREMVGPTDSTAAEKGTIRGDFGQDKMRNVVHASDSVENGQAELKRFFAEGELFG